MSYKDYKKVGLPWLEEVPRHWDMERAKFYIYSKKEINKDKKITNVLSLTLNGVIRNDAENPIGLSPSDYATYQIFNNNDLVFKLIDLNNIRTSRVGLVKELGIMSSAYIRGIIDNNILWPKYIYYWYYKLYLEEVYNKLGSGVRSTLSSSELLEMEIPIPPKEEQEQIARFLDWKINEIDRLISKKKEKLKILDNYIKINIFKMFDDLNNEEIPLKRILSEKMTDGPHETPSFVDNGIPFVSVEAVENGRINLDKKRGFISRESSQIYRKKVKPQKDDIFIVKSGSTTGKIAYVNFDDEFDIWSPLALVRVKNNINKKYVFYYLSSDLFQQQIKDNWTFGTQPNIGMSTLINLKIKIPSKKEQDFLANNIELRMKKFENLKDNIKKQINNLKQLKQSLISDVVTGKIDVRNLEIPNYEKINDIEDYAILEENFEEEV
ncbi:restriction endonuclease subunit S [Peptoniphilus harei]|uniref:restriction endonuclease subunit S n=1 Tax=Peptoniphilus TaxID=162289 RepID=UPI00254B5262|nr:restriction endonuclease subunit S [Peptoniphilus harei]MDK7377341.1 restriction endonuclease subunit S [Peptoniphilus harei]MDK7679654.1 restriction endonuclease subunit S [Peptoniphilus harei]